MIDSIIHFPKPRNKAWTVLGSASRAQAAPPRAFHFACLMLVVAIGLAAPRVQAASQAVIGAGPTKGFHLEDYYRGVPGQKDKIKVRISGAEAYYQLGSSSIPIKGLRVEFYDLSGKTNLLIEAEDCIYSKVQEQDFATSTNRLRVTSGGGELQLEGQGFLWRKNADVLTVSNATRALIQRKQPVEITSRGSEFSQTERRVSFWDKVRAHDPEMDITSEWLTIKLRATNSAMETVSSESQVEQIVAETNVVVSLPDQQTETRSDRAEYQFENGQDRVELTGHPTWKRAEREGSADRLLFDRHTKLFIAQGNSYAKLPSGDMIQSSDLFQSLAQPTNRAPVAAHTNEFVEIRADESRLWTNGAVFKGLVRANETDVAAEPVRLSCGLLTITNSSPTAKFDVLTLVNDVVIEQGRTNIHASRLDYDKSRQIAKFSGKVAWQMGPQSGAADLIRFNTEHREMSARDHASLFLQLDQSAHSLIPGFASTNAAATNRPRSLKIICDQYDWEPGLAMFRGGVRVTELAAGQAEGTLSCELLVVRMATNSVQIESLLAETNVQYTIAPNEHATNAMFRKLDCQRLVGEFERGAPIRMVAENGVQVHLKDGIVHGDRLNYDISKEQAELTGSPSVESSMGTMTCPIIYLDLKAHTIWTPNYRVVMPLKSRKNPVKP
jgi:lipopolysaccharide export system protein LptA